MAILKHKEVFKLFLNNTKKYDLTVNALKIMYCEGYTDINGEWIPMIGNYYLYIPRHIYNINHNYEVDINKFKSKWILRIYMCLTASNSKEIALFNKSYRTLKLAKSEAIKFLNEYDASEKAKEDVEKWKTNHATPVFIIHDGQPELIGTTYNYIGNDSMRHNDNFTYYNDDMPDYHYKYHTDKFYQLIKLYDRISISCCEINPYGYCGSGVKDEDLLNRMLEIIKPIPKYQHIFDFLNKNKVA